MNFVAFGIGVWHPFGPHGRETPEQISDRKRGEIDVKGRTLWSVIEAHGKKLHCATYVPRPRKCNFELIFLFVTSLDRATVYYKKLD